MPELQKLIAGVMTGSQHEYKKTHGNYDMTKEELRAAAPQSAAFVDEMRKLFGPDLRVLRIVEGKVNIDKRPAWMKDEKK